MRRHRRSIVCVLNLRCTYGGSTFSAGESGYSKQWRVYSIGAAPSRSLSCGALVALCDESNALTRADALVQHGAFVRLPARSAVSGIAATTDNARILTFTPPPSFPSSPPPLTPDPFSFTASLPSSV